MQINQMQNMRKMVYGIERCAVYSIKNIQKNEEITCAYMEKQIEEGN